MYGMTIYDSNGNITLNISDNTPRLVTLGTISVPSSGSVIQSISTEATPSNSIAITDSGSPATVTATGVVTVYSTGSSYTTNYRVLLV